MVTGAYLYNVCNMINFMDKTIFNNVNDLAKCAQIRYNILQKPNVTV